MILLQFQNIEHFPGSNCHSQVDSFVHWAFTDRRDTSLMECFRRTMKVCGGRGEFADGVPIASICTGWGVAEMVLDCLNEKLAEMDPKVAKAGVAPVIL